MKCKRVPLRAIRAGTVLTQPVTDPVDPRVVLLGKGVAVTEAFLDRLEQRGVETVILSQRDIAILNAFKSQGRRRNVPPAPQYVRSSEQNDHTRSLDHRLESSDVLRMPSVDQTFAANVSKPHDVGYPDGLDLQWASRGAEQVDQIEEFFDDTLEQGSHDTGPLRQTCFDILSRISEDQDAFVCYASTPHESDYPSRHGVHLAGIAISMGVDLGLDRDALIDLGIGCLIHDIGMKAVGVEMFDTKKPLSPSQLSRLSNHPVRAVAIAGKYGESISELSKLVAYQIHERNDGSGYPRGTSSDQIHPLSKIAAIADAYVGMLTRRRHRLAIQGYYVMAALLDEMKNGKFDAHAMRSLLNIASLYPLGSYVELNNECVGRVIRSGEENFVRPTIELWHPEHLDNEPAIVNLKHEPSLRIVGSIANPKAA